MANKGKGILIKEEKGVVILDLDKYRKLNEMLEEYKRKKKLLRSLERFENLAKWGRSFAKKKKITPKQVLEND